MLESRENVAPSLEADPRTFFDFFRAFSSAPDPLLFLGERGVSEADLFQLLGHWQRALASEHALQLEVLALLREPPRSAPMVSPDKLSSRSLAQEQAHRETNPSIGAPLPAAPLAATSLGFVVAKSALPFVSSPSESAAQSPLPTSVRSPPLGLGETRPTFRVDRPALPFAGPKEAPLPVAAQVAPRSLSETAPSVVLPRPALPFSPSSGPPMQGSTPPQSSRAPRSLGETKPVFHVYKPAALPFQKSLGETAPSFQIDKQVLPFAKGPSAPFAKGPAAPTAPAPSLPLPSRPSGSLGETSLALGVNLSRILPFSAPKAPSPRLSVEHYAAMCAEIWLAPADALSTIARYGLNAETKPAEDGAWQARFSASPEERANWERLAIEAGARIRAAGKAR